MRAILVTSKFAEQFANLSGIGTMILKYKRDVTDMYILPFFFRFSATSSLVKSSAKTHGQRCPSMSVGYRCREFGKVGRTKYYIIHTIQYRVADQS